MHLTEKRVRDARPGDVPRIDRDDETAGLGLRVMPAGTKAFVFDYRIEGRRRMLTLGRVGEIGLAHQAAAWSMATAAACIDARRT